MTPEEYAKAFHDGEVYAGHVDNGVLPSDASNRVIELRLADVSWEDVCRELGEDLTRP